MCAGYIYELAFRQFEISDTRVFDRRRCEARPECVVTFTQVTRPSQIDGQHAPGLPFGDPRVMAVMAAVIGFPTCSPGLTTLPWTAPSPTCSAAPTPAGRPHTACRLKRKALIVRLPGHHRYHLTPLGQRVAVLFT